MMKKTLLPAAAVSALFLVLLSGCFTPNMNGPCCLKDGAMNGTCTMYTAPGPDDSQPKTEVCNGNALAAPDNRVCKTLYCVVPEYQAENMVYVKHTGTSSSALNCTNVSLTNKSEPCNNVGYCVLSIGSEFASYPICTEREEVAYDENCKTMLCGNIKYSPLRSLLPTASANPMYQASFTGETKGLYNAMCNFFVLDKKTVRKINKGSNIFVNTLRFGAGASINDFEVAKLYFPMSDKFCGFSPSGNAGILRDRYMNYLDLGVQIPLGSSIGADSNTVLLLHMDGSGASFADSSSSSRTVTANGHVTQSATLSKLGGKSGYFDGADDYLSFASSSDFALGTGDFTIDAWVYLQDGTGSGGGTASNVIYSCNSNGEWNSKGGGCLLYAAGGIFGVWTADDYTHIETAANYPINNWYHVALVRSGSGANNLKLYVNGAMAAQRTYNGNIGSATSVPAVGFYDQWGGGRGWWNGYIDEFRLSNTARWTGDFTPGASATSTNSSESYYGPYDPGNINSSTCAGGTENFPPAGGTSGTGYLFNTYTEGTGQFATQYVLPDPEAYERSLYGAYWPSIRNGTLASSASSSSSFSQARSSGVPYECSTGSECFSGICAMQDFGYERSYCAKNDGTLANCLCREYGARSQADSQVRCKQYLDQEPITVPTQKVCSYGAQTTTGTGCCYTDNSRCEQWGYDEGSSYCARYDSKCVATVECDEACASAGWNWWSNSCSGYSFWGEDVNPPSCTADGFNGHCSDSAQISTNVENCEAGGAAGEIIFLTNFTKDNYTGYAIMDGSQFPGTMFYTRCGLGPADYDILEASSVVGNTLVYINTTIKPGGLFVNWTSLACVEWEPPPELESSGGWFQMYFTPVAPPPKCAKATSIVRIKSLGQCKADQGGTYGFDPVKSFPQLNNTLGWCEPCTSVTMLGMDLDSTWDKYSSYSVSCVPGYTEFGQMAVIGKCADKIKPVIDNLAAFRDRVDHYLKAGVMPVVWYTRGGFGDSAQVVASRYKICGPCSSVQNPGLGIDYLRQVLVGMRFYYPPDFTSFFVNVSGGCGYDNHCTYQDKPDCPCPMNAAPPQSIQKPNEALGEFGDTLGGTQAENYDSASKEKGASLGWFSCSTTYGVACSWTATYDFFKKAIGNSGSLVIVATDSMDDATIISRAYAAKQTCPRCLVAIYSSMDKGRLDSLFGCNSGELSCSISHNRAWELIDAIAYDENLNVRSVTDKNATMIEQTTSRARELVVRYGKPGFPYNFVVDDSLYNWEPYGDTKEAMTNLLKKREDIVTSGIFALYYKQLQGAGTEPLIGDNLRDQKFCAFQQAMNNYFQPIKKKTIFIATPAVPFAECSECTNADLLFKTCNTTCDNNVQCSLPAGKTDTSKYRCPAKTIVDPCRPCNDSFNNGAMVQCNITYNDNTVESMIPRALQSLAGANGDLYGDVIASLPKDEKCCLSEQINDSGNMMDYNYSYSKISGETYGTMPVRFPRSGDKGIDCGLVGDDIVFCGVKLDIKDYSIDCWVQRP